MLIIECEKVAKMYRLYANSRQRLREGIFRKKLHHEFWALRNVSFSLSRGESLGLLGENGAGKSTLLKLLSGTSQQTSGRIEMHGKVTSILDLGAGFHPDFTGRDNLVTYGMLMGFSREEIIERMEEIIRFADIGEFIDQPVRTYSSGMFVRLAFSCATGFEPDILVIDEVLAVGDQQFQKKCVDRILGYKKAGKTIVFCSHNMYQLKEVSDRALWLKGGQPESYGEPQLVIEDYLDYQRIKGQSEGGPHLAKLGEGCVGVLTKVELCSEKGEPCAQFKTGDPVLVKIWTRFSPDVSQPGVGVGIKRSADLACYLTSTQIDCVPMIDMGNGEFYTELKLLNLELLSGRYTLSLATTDEQGMLAYDIWDGVCPFIVTHSTREYGLFRLDHQWLAR
jgi:ABC-type polysaccharide/polyol phosphate transport system ATPase subunit